MLYIGNVEVHGSQVYVSEHALKQFRIRVRNLDSNSIRRTAAILNKLQDDLKRSDIAIRRHTASIIIKNDYERAVYRYYDRWLYVLVWSYDLESWILKTAYPLDKGSLVGSVRVIPIPAELKAESWKEEYEPPVPKLTRKQKRHLKHNTRPNQKRQYRY